MGCVASRPESVELVPEAGIGPGAGTRVGATEEHDIVGIILLVNVPRDTPVEDRERCEVPPPVQEVEVVAEPVEVVVEPEPELVPQPVPAVVEPEPVPRPAPVPVKYEDIELDDFLPSVVREMEPSGSESLGARDGVIALPPIIEVAEPDGPAVDGAPSLPPRGAAALPPVVVRGLPGGARSPPPVRVRRRSGERPRYEVIWPDSLTPPLRRGGTGGERASRRRRVHFVVPEDAEDTDVIRAEFVTEL